MSQKILITKFNYNLPEKGYRNAAASMAQQFAEVPGCQWKIWLIDDSKKEAGAVYLFNDEESLENFKNSPLVAAVLAHPDLSNFDLRTCDVLKDISEITRAPLMETSEA